MYNSELKKGDILLFKAYKSPTVSQQLIRFGEIFNKAELGQNDTVHAALCLGHNLNGKILIAHVSPASNGYLCEELDEMFNRDKQKPDFMVYRPNNPNFASFLAVVAASKSSRKIDNYSLVEGLKTLIYSGKKVKNDPASKSKEYSQDSFCSRFVIESITQAVSLVEHELFKQYELEIHENSTPKALESALNTKGRLFSCFFCEPEKNIPLQYKEQPNETFTELDDIETKSNFNTL
ncbi:hypothetical protein [Legionella clemsonensis]|uniref:Uncharacterized protein n=1 Tax=Legionella clemsonensis TaxID=1867846 RepID=A0A222P406_9GAMM|nr:hypothetical protein [Legionella clemsonensis]ASQ46590.1 hypothetical protein clem_10205 [Legionella clemsonensis]